MSLKDFIATNVETTAGPLTREALDAAWEQAKNAPPHPCSLGKHVVSATALREGWEYATCGNCYGLVKLR